ncbi:MAG: BlaI/MecI/CopY family transcriptional regulator [Candidatus Aenigmatarchaeota archaeon]
MDIKKIKFDKSGLRSVLNPLESDIMLFLWKSKRAKVRDIHSKLKKKHGVALTSVAVTTDRLYKKGFVERKVGKGLGGLHYIYSPAKTKEQLERSIIDNTVNKLIDIFGPNAVSYFNERFSRGKKNV